MRGLELTADDLLRRSIIQALMCHFELSIEAIEIAHLIDFRKYFAGELVDLAEMAQAGLIEKFSAMAVGAAARAHAGARYRDGVRQISAP